MLGSHSSSAYPAHKRIPKATARIVNLKNRQGMKRAHKKKSRQYFKKIIREEIQERG